MKKTKVKGVKKVMKALKKASNTHAKQARTLEIKYIKIPKDSIPLGGVIRLSQQIILLLVKSTPKKNYKQYLIKI
jgi:translation initiation factor 2 alpha subunit (eIF-2alpha)